MFLVVLQTVATSSQALRGTLASNRPSKMRRPLSLPLLLNTRHPQQQTANVGVPGHWLNVIFDALLNQPAFPNYTVKDMMSDLSHAIVALYGHLPVGYLAIDHSHQQPTTAYMHILWVHPHFRRLGIAKRLLYLGLKKYEGKRDVLLHVDCGNTEAMCIYQLFGFKSEAFLLGFYEGESHLLPSSSRNGNAFYMRLRK